MLAASGCSTVISPRTWPDRSPLLSAVKLPKPRKWYGGMGGQEGGNVRGQSHVSGHLVGLSVTLLGMLTGRGYGREGQRGDPVLGTMGNDCAGEAGSCTGSN